jgi:hypothetical protein
VDYVADLVYSEFLVIIRNLVSVLIDYPLGRGGIPDLKPVCSALKNLIYWRRPALVANQCYIPLDLSPDDIKHRLGPLPGIALAYCPYPGLNGLLPLHVR